MAQRIAFILDKDKDFSNLYTKLLENKGWQVFATDNLFILLKYAASANPEWIFIDESYADNQKNKLVNLINQGLPFNATHYAFLSQDSRSATPFAGRNTEIIYKPRFLEKLMNITENSCNIR
jgi:DNA-binding NtrC family response regulator